MRRPPHATGRPEGRGNGNNLSGSSHLFVCCWPCLCVPVGTIPSSSCASLFVFRSLRRSRLGSRAVCNRQRRDEALYSCVAVSPRGLSPRHPAQRRPAIVLVPFGTPPDHGALIFLFVKERAADCVRCSRNRVARRNWRAGFTVLKGRFIACRENRKGRTEVTENTNRLEIQEHTKSPLQA